MRSFLLSAITQTEKLTQTEKPASQKEPTTPHTVKLRGAPFNVTEVRATNRVRQGDPGEGGDKAKGAWSLCCTRASGSVEDLSWKELRA